uniref:Uncharacterized protein n=1 Tax=Knipowitschia caucasica TaxID=637954 RepID=A0AAV2LRN2_KNICA
MFSQNAQGPEKPCLCSPEEEVEVEVEVVVVVEEVEVEVEVEVVVVVVVVEEEEEEEEESFIVSRRWQSREPTLYPVCGRRAGVKHCISSV